MIYRDDRERKKERQEKRKKKERKRAKNKIKSAHLWLLLIVIKSSYTGIGFVSLITGVSQYINCVWSFIFNSLFELKL